MAKKPESEVIEPVAETAPVLYVFPVDIEVTGPNGLTYQFQGGVARAIPESVVEAALAAGIQRAS